MDNNDDDDDLQTQKLYDVIFYLILKNFDSFFSRFYFFHIDSRTGNQWVAAPSEPSEPSWGTGLALFGSKSWIADRPPSSIVVDVFNKFDQ